MGKAGRVRIAGALAVFADGFRGELERGGYSGSTMEAQLQLMAHVSGWLDCRALGACDLTDARVEEYLAYRRACGRTHGCSSRALDALRGLDVAPGSRPAPIVTPSDRLLAEFEQYLLLRDRCLVERTVQGYHRVARSFLVSCLEEGDLRLERLTAADVTAFMVVQSACRSAGSLGNTITGLRALLRFLDVRGHTTLALAAAVPAVAQRRADAARCSRPARSGDCSQAAIGAGRSAGATTRS